MTTWHYRVLRYTDDRPSGVQRFVFLPVAVFEIVPHFFDGGNEDAAA